MKFADKDFDYYWNIIKMPVALLIGWSVLAIIVAKISMYWYNSIFGTWSGLILQIAIFGYVGYTIVAEHKGHAKQSIWGGTFAGAIAGFAGAVLGILMIYIAPEIIDMAIRQAVTQGISEDMVRKMIEVGMYIGLITAPLISGIMGALFGWIGGLIAARSK